MIGFLLCFPLFFALLAGSAGEAAQELGEPGIWSKWPSLNLLLTLLFASMNKSLNLCVSQCSVWKMGMMIILHSSTMVWG